jgi:methionine aminotransferase
MESTQSTVDSKLPGVGDTIFAEITGLTDSHDAINLSQGFPNFGAPKELIRRVTHHMQAGNNQYPPMPGVFALKEKLAEKIEALYGAQVDPDSEITVTAGASQAIQMIITAFVHEGDEVIIFDPAFDIYDPCVKLQGGIPRHIKLDPPEFQVDWKEVEKRVDENTRLLIINTPHNPTGSILESEDLKQLERIAVEYDLLVLSDEVYQHMVYDGKEHQSVLRYEHLRERSLAVFSFGKTYHVTGWKVGYLAAPEYLTEEFRKVFQYGMFAVSSPMQYAFADFLEHSQHYVQLANFYQNKRDLFHDILSQTDFELLPCHGTYYQCVRYDGISNQPDTEFVRHLIENHGVAAIPVSPFYEDGVDERVIRFCFAKTRETLEKAGEKLLAI